LGASELEQAVESALERPVFVPEGQGGVRIRGQVKAVEAKDADWEVTLVLERHDGKVLGRRQLGGEGPCRRLDEPVALVIALALQSLEGRVEPRAPAEPSAPPDAQAHSGDSRRVHVQEHPPRPERGWSGSVGVFATAAAGLLPTPWVGVGWMARVDPANMWPVSLGAAWWPKRTALQQGRGAEFRTWTASMALCPPLWSGGPVALHGCAGMRVDILQATGVGLTTSRTTTSVMYAAQARISSTIELGSHFALLVRVGAVVPFVRDRFVYEVGERAERRIHRPSPVVGVADLGIVVQIP
jgi:hypothetical protein